MEICKAYKTSKGIYLTKEQAECNRVKIPHSDHLLCYKEKEAVVEIWVLITDWDFDGDWDFSMPGAFILTPVNIINGE